MGQTTKAILWDLDGVLVDTGEMHFLAFQVVLPEYGIPFTAEDFKVIFGMGNREGLAYLNGSPLDETLLAQIDQAKEARFRGLVHGRARTLPGVMEWLDYFRNQNFLQAIASSAPQANIDALVEELGLRSYFDLILSAPGNGLPAKPYPAVFLESARRLGVEPADCWVIEDSTAGVEAAKRAGMHCIAVTSTNQREQLSMADHVVESLTMLDKDWFAQDHH